MLLTTEQESILNGEQGKTRQKAIRLLIDLGKAAKSSARKLAASSGADRKSAIYNIAKALIEFSGTKK